MIYLANYGDFNFVLYEFLRHSLNLGLSSAF